MHIHRVPLSILLSSIYSLHHLFMTVGNMTLFQAFRWVINDVILHHVVHNGPPIDPVTSIEIVMVTSRINTHEMDAKMSSHDCGMPNNLTVKAKTGWTTHHRRTFVVTRAGKIITTISSAGPVSTQQFSVPYCFPICTWIFIVHSFWRIVTFTTNSQSIGGHEMQSFIWILNMLDRFIWDRVASTEETHPQSSVAFVYPFFSQIRHPYPYAPVGRFISTPVHLGQAVNILGFQLENRGPNLLDCRSTSSFRSLLLVEAPPWKMHLVLITHSKKWENIMRLLNVKSA